LIHKEKQVISWEIVGLMHLLESKSVGEKLIDDLTTILIKISLIFEWIADYIIEWR
jgi:hypothetical protein